MYKILFLITLIVVVAGCSDEKEVALKAETERQAVCDRLQNALDDKKSQGLAKNDWNNFVKEFNKTIPEGCTIRGNGRIQF